MLCPGSLKEGELSSVEVELELNNGVDLIGIPLLNGSCKGRPDVFVYHPRLNFVLLPSHDGSSKVGDRLPKKVALLVIPGLFSPGARHEDFCELVRYLENSAEGHLYDAGRLPYSD